MVKTIAVAIVVDVNDPGGAGRIRVSLPGVGHDEPWARIVRPLAKADPRLPEIGDEVLVLFEDSSVQRAYVLGSL